MASIIQFPLSKAADNKVENKIVPGSQKILNIADWTAKNPVCVGAPNVDNWPLSVA